MNESNRIVAAVAKKKQDIADRIANKVTTKKAVKELHGKLDMELDEYVRFQELKSRAVLHNKLTTEEGMTIYNYLGNSLETFNKQPIEVKVVLTGLLAELLQMSMAGKI